MGADAASWSPTGTRVPVLWPPGAWGQGLALDRVLPSCFAREETDAKREGWWVVKTQPHRGVPSWEPADLRVAPARTPGKGWPGLEPLPQPQKTGSACTAHHVVRRGSEHWGPRGHSARSRRSTACRGAAQAAPALLKLPPLSPGFSNQGVVGPALCGQRALAGDPVYAGLPAALHQLRLLQVPAGLLGARRARRPSSLRCL